MDIAWTLSGMNFFYWRKISHIRHSETEASSSSRFVTPPNSSDLAHFARQLRTNNTHTVSSALSLCQPTTEAAEEDYHHATRAQHSHTHSLTVEPPKMEGRKEGRGRIVKLSISAFGDIVSILFRLYELIQVVLNPRNQRLRIA